MLDRTNGVIVKMCFHCNKNYYWGLLYRLVATDLLTMAMPWSLRTREKNRSAPSTILDSWLLLMRCVKL